MMVLKLEIKRVNNTVNGNPRYKIMNWDSEELLDKIIKNGFIRDLKKGYFTKSDSSYCNSILNKKGVEIDDVNIICECVY